jgi:hypothetical protein
MQFNSIKPGKEITLEMGRIVQSKATQQTKQVPKSRLI